MDAMKLLAASLFLVLTGVFFLIFSITQLDFKSLNQQVKTIREVVVLNNTIYVPDNKKEVSYKLVPDHSLEMSREKRSITNRKLLSYESDLMCTALPKSQLTTHNLTRVEQIESLCKLAKVVKQRGGDEVFKVADDNAKVSCSGCSNLLLSLGVKKNDQYEVEMIKSEDGFFSKTCEQNSSRSSSCTHDVDTSFNIHCSNGQKSLSSTYKPPTLEVCKVDNSVYKTCTNTIENLESHEFVVVSDKIYVVDDLVVKYDYDYSNPMNYHNFGLCGSDCFTKYDCKGDEIYKKSFFRKGLPKKDNCEVKYDYSKVSFMMLDKKTSKYEFITCYGTGLFNVAIKAHKEISQTHEADVSANCDKGTIRVMSKNSEVLQYKVCHGFNCISDMVGQRKFDIKLPAELQTIDASFRLHLNLKGFQKISQKVRCKKVSVCDQIDCIFCLKAMFNPRCYKPVHYILLTSATTYLFFMAFLITYTAYRTVKLIEFLCWVGKMLLLPVKKVIKNLMRYMSRLMESYRRRTEGENEQNEVQEVLIHGRDQLNRIAARQRLINGAGLLVLMLVMVVSTEGQSCVHHSYIEGSEVSCKKDRTSGVRSCRVSKVLEIDLFPHELDSCITLKGKNGKVLRTLMFSVVDMFSVCDKSTVYYTGDVQTSVTSEVHCPSVAYCSPSYCSSVAWDDNLPYETDANKHAGVTRCEPSCGSFACGCFYPGDSCATYRVYYTNPTREELKVTTCTGWKSNFKIRVNTLTHGSGKKTTDTETSLGVRTLIDNSYHITVSGISKSLEGDHQSSFIKHGASYFLCRRTNQKGSFSTKALGFVQCGSIDSARDISRNCEIKNSNLAVTVVDNIVTDKSETLNFKDWLSKECTALPFDSENKIFDHDQAHGYHYHHKSSDLLRLKIEMEDYEIEEEESDVSCDMKFTSISGCYNCLVGAKVDVMASATDEQTLIHLSCPNGPSTSISVGTEPEETDFRLVFSEALVNENCSFYCGDHKGWLVIKGNLDYVDDFSGMFSRTRSDMIKTHSWSFMQSLYSTFGTIHSYIGYLVVAIAVVLTSIIISIILRVTRDAMVLVSSKKGS